jgi:hypothetical protein
MGDATFFGYVKELQTPKHPLLDGNLHLTPAGGAVLANHSDAVSLNGIDRWLGGVHLSGAGAKWRWDEDNQVLVGGS